MIAINTEKLTECPICGSSKLSIFLQGFDYETYTGPYNIEECDNCHLKFTNPRPIASDISKLYEQRTSADFVKSSPIVDTLRSFSIRLFLKTLPKLILAGNKRILDFGCGDGFFAKEVAAFNLSLSLVAMDFHESSPPRIKQNSQIEYKPYTCLAETDGFDVIFCRHVLEHALDPAETIRELCQRLNQSGYLIIEVPNVNSIWAKVFKKYYCAYYLPRHLFHFDQTTLRSMLGLFDEVEIELRHTPLLGGSLGYFLSRPAMANTGYLGLSLYPLQIVIDKLANSSSCLLAIARNTHRFYEKKP